MEAAVPMVTHPGVSYGNFRAGLRIRVVDVIIVRLKRHFCGLHVAHRVVVGPVQLGARGRGVQPLHPFH
ncbi:hypothetical protein J6590_003670 [Homalodisca vitripennis]|nr:hypothetical protein J6590_003670 [Homalodisca vitripennis]